MTSFKQPCSKQPHSGVNNNDTSKQPTTLSDCHYPFGRQNDLGNAQSPSTCCPAFAERSLSGESTVSQGCFSRSSSNHTSTVLYPPQSLIQTQNNVLTNSSSHHSLHSCASSSCHSSHNSSIYDLTAEIEALETAIKQNDVLFVKRMLQIHYGKFNVNLHGSIMGKSSCDSQSHCISQNVEILLCKSQTLLERYRTCRQDSAGNTSDLEQSPPPSIFVNALHVAIESDVTDVVRLLLKYGVDPDACGVNPGYGNSRCAMTKFDLGDDQCCEGNDDQIVTHVITMRDTLAPHMKTVDMESTGTRLIYTDVYTREKLYSLPPLFLAVALNRTNSVHLLLKYRALASIQDVHGVSPLHLAACIDNIPWDSVLVLVENGAKIAIQNKQGFTPSQMLDPELVKIQASVIDEIFKDLNMYLFAYCRHLQTEMDGGPKYSHLKCDLHHKVYNIARGRPRSSKSSDDASNRPSVSSSCSSNIDDEQSPQMVATRTKSYNEDSKTNQQPSSVSSFSSKKLRNNPCDKPDSDDAISVIEEVLRIIHQMSSNSECLERILTGLYSFCGQVIELADRLGDLRTITEKSIASLLHISLTTIVNDSKLNEDSDLLLKSKETACRLCMILCVSTSLLHGGHSLQFTSLLTINKIIDVCSKCKLGYCKVKLPQMFTDALNGTGSESQANQVNTVSGPNNRKFKSPSSVNGGKDSSDKDKGITSGAARKWANVKRQVLRDKSPENIQAETSNNEKRPERTKGEETVIGVLKTLPPVTILNVLHNAITLHKRVVGTRHSCNPSVRSRNCSYHCLQILSARTLLYVAHTDIVQTQLSNEAHLKILASALDSTHDPQLLCLVLQVVANIALNPMHHSLLTEAEIPDALMPLLLPSDEWYYTNHTTRYARYVKHHAARILIYMGLQHRLRNKVSLFELIEGAVGSAHVTSPMIESCEDQYVLDTSCALPKLCNAKDAKEVLGMSPEGLVYEMLKSLENNFHTDHICDLNFLIQDSSIVLEDKRLEMNSSSSKTFYDRNLQLLIQGISMVLHPIIVVRLLEHRLMSTAPKRRSQSVASKSSVSSSTGGSVSDYKNKETTPEPGLGARRNVNLTLSYPGRVSRSSSLKSRKHETRFVIQTDESSMEISSPCDDGPSASSTSGGGGGGGGSNTFKNSGKYSPGSHTRWSFRFSSLKRRKSKSHANVSSNNEVTSDLGSYSSQKEEVDINQFQKEILNLPHFDSRQSNDMSLESSATPSPRHSRPRSCSVPKVVYDRYHLAPPNYHYRSQSISARSTPRVASPISQGDKSGQASTDTSVISMVMPFSHKAVLSMMSFWAKLVCGSNNRYRMTMIREVDEMTAKVSMMGNPYQDWSDSLRVLLDMEDTERGVEKHQTPESVDDEYRQLQELILNEDLPCSKEEASALAGIQLRIEESWPSKERITSSKGGTSQQQQHDNGGQDKLITITEDIKESVSVSESPLHGIQNGSGDLYQLQPHQELSTSKHRCMNNSVSPKITSKESLLRRCIIGTSYKSTNITSNTLTLQECLPSVYHNVKNIAKIVKEQKRKLFHTSVYESELHLKKLYILSCKRLPAYGCKTYQVKELVRSKTKKKTNRLLAIGPERIVLLDNKTRLLNKSQLTSDLQQWQTGGGRSHDRLILEFRGTKWSFVAPSQSTLKSIGFGLWEMMQQIDTKFIEENILQTTSIDSFSNGERQFSVDGKPRCGSLKYTAELEHLQKILHFPEEVALALTKTEYDLFYQVQPWQYIRHIIVDLSLHGSCYNEHRRHHPTTTQSLIQRFNEVSSWVTHIIISQPTHDDRKAVLSCILRTALTCWNIGNFNTSMEIVAGLKSEKLKPFWLSLSEKESLPVLEMLTNALLTSEPSKQYREAVDNALSIPRCRVIPFFGSFLRDLRAVFNGMPNLLVISEIDNIDFASDCNGEDQFSTKMGVGGIVNMEKLKQVQQILDDVRAFHYHKQKRDELLSASMNLDLDDLWSNCMSYKPVQTISSDHGVSFIPLSSTAIDINNLQCLHHGTTVIRWEEDTSRVSACHLRFDRSNAYLIWSKPTWSTTRGSEYHLSSSIEDPVIAGIGLDYTSSDMVCDSLEDGYLLLSSIKEVCLGYDSNVDVSLISRRFSLDDISKDKNCLVLFYGSNLSDNRRIEFVGPVEVILLWYEGLTQILTVYQKMKEFPDRRINWLKQRYMQLYYQDGVCEGPIPAEAIKVFGGRKWTLGGVGGSGSNLLSAEIGCHGFKRAASLGMSTNKFRKKKSSGNLNLVKDPSQRHSGDSPSMERPTSALIPRSSLIVTPQTVARVLSGVKYTCNSKQNSSKDRSFEQKSNLTPVVNTHCLSQNFRERYKYKRNGRVSDGPVFQQTVITHSSHIDFLEFTDLFKSFIVRCRKDLKDLFEQVANKNPSPNEKTQVEPSKSNYAAENTDSPVSLTRNTMCDLDRFSNRKRICDAIAAASIVTNSTGIDTSTNLSINVKTFQSFMSQYQNEKLSHEQILELIERHEPDEEMRKQGFLSFQGFARFLMDKHNFAFLSEETVHDESEMDHALSDYYIASSHNTYLTGHQLKGESSVELYSQVLLTGCRCVELDCWDGDDGMPVIYHGHTLTTKIPFKDVVEAINKSAFVTSPYPVILSIENHCSVQQQAKMAQIFLSVFGDKLLTRMISDLDFDDPQLPSPNHLKYKVLIKNKKLRTRVYAAMKNKSKSDMRANSIASNTSTCSLNDEEDDDYDDEDDDDDDDLSDDRETGIMNDSPSGLNLLGSQEDKQSSVDTGSLTKSASMGMRTESLSSQEESIKEKVNGNHRPKSQSDADWPEANYQAYKQRKSSAQIAKELSDLVVYCQAIKFRGLLHTTSPATTAKIKKMTKKASVMVSPVGLKPSTPPPPTETKTNLDYASSNNTISRRHMLSAPCYQVSSMNENTAKKLCRKQPQSLIAHTEVQLIRTYPAGIRIDSSNFNPIMFWAFGMQMVALNYQTEDTALHINTAMFEQNGNCGYVLKPRVMWDHTHMMYRRFNPWDKEFDGLHMINIEITVIAGQYVCQNNNAGSAMVEVEIIGIPADCCRQKTKLVQRNSLNPIWNDTFNFKVAFGDLAFIKFTITDVGTNHITAQRVMPLKSLRPGYRHVRLRNLQNQPLELSSLFIFSHSEEEGLDMTDKNDDGLEDNMVILDQINCNVTDDKLGGNESFSLSSVPLKRRMFFLVVHGVTQDEQSTILKITQESTTREVIKQSLAKAHKLENKCPDDYIMIEEVSKGWSKKDQDKVTSHRILDMDERPLEAQDQWKGEGKLILKKTGDDPSSRAWMTTIKSSTDKNRRKKMSDRPQMNDLENDWEDEEEMFLVCVYNVSPDQPYTILRAPVTSTAQDLIAQALVKAHRMTDPTQFVLVEQIDYGEFTDACAGPMKRRNTLRNERRLLGDDENVYQVQARWKGKGWFELRSKNEAPQEKKLLKNLRLSKLHQSFRSKSKSKMKNKEETPPVERQTSGSTEDIPKNNCVATAAAQVRNIHSEGEILSDDEIKDTKFSVQHLKRLSLRKFKVWR